MKATADFGFRILDWRCVAIAAFAVVVFALPVFADSKAETMKPLGQSVPAGAVDKEVVRKELEAEYRKALEERLAQEKASYEGSLRSLWMANAAVWTVLLLFVAMHALSARKRGRELERLRAAREAPADRS